MSNRLMIDGVCSRLISAFVFEEQGAVQSIIHHLKYEGNRSLGTLLGNCLAQRFLQDCSPHGIAGVIPVPLHRTKERERGYNQSALIANAFAATTGIPARTDILVRRRFTVSQTTLARAERLENVRDAFIVRRERREAVSGNTFIIVDDVITTGATIRSCAQALASEGGKPAVACSVALAE
jgi:ComF family protein